MKLNPDTLIDSSAEWFAHNARYYFAAGSAYLALQEIKPFIPSLQTLQPSQATMIAGQLAVPLFGPFWNAFDAMVSLTEGIKGMWVAGEATRFHRDLILLSSGELATATHLFVTLPIFPLVAVGVLGATSIVIPATSFAVAMSYSAIRSAIELKRALKETDMAELLKDKMERYENVSKRLNVEKYGKEIVSADNISEEWEKEIEINPSEKQVKLEKDLARLKTQINAIIRVKKNSHAFRKPAEAPFNAFIKRNEAFAEEGEFSPFDDRSLPTETDKRLVTLLQRKQAEKVYEKAISLLEWTAEAIGTGLITASVFFPAMLPIGIAVVLIATALKMIHTIHKHGIASLPKETRAKISGQAQGKLSKDKTRTLLTGWLSDPEKPINQHNLLNYFMAYQNYKAHTGEKLVFKSYCEKLMQEYEGHPKQLNKHLRLEIKVYFQEVVVAESLGIKAKDVFQHITQQDTVKSKLFAKLWEEKGLAETRQKSAKQPKKPVSTPREGGEKGLRRRGPNDAGKKLSAPKRNP